MKLFSTAVLLAASTAPAFCQTISEIKKDLTAVSADVATLVNAQVDAQVDARVKTELDLAGLSNLNFDFARADEFEAKAEEMAAKAEEIAARFDSADFAYKFDTSQMAKLDEQMARLKGKFDTPEFKYKLDKAGDVLDNFNMAFLQPPPKSAAAAAPAPGPTPMAGKIFINRPGRVDSEYSAGRRALDQHKYDEAAQHFDAVIEAKANRVDGALYWKAYALNRAGKRDEALAALAQLRRDYAGSGYLNDAQALEAEVKQNAGRPVSPEQETSEDNKLIAINALMNADAERAIPLVEGVLKGTTAPNVKDRALFVLSQNKSPRAQQSLIEYAKGGGNPDLQTKAIEYVGMSGTKEAQQQLGAIYAASSDARIKNTILQALMSARASDILLSIAKSEKDPALRNAAIRYLMSIRGFSSDTLVDLYGSSDAQTKREMIDGFMGRNDAKTLIDLARKESDPSLKKTIVERLGSMRGSKEALDYMAELLK